MEAHAHTIFYSGRGNRFPNPGVQSPVPHRCAITYVQSKHYGEYRGEAALATILLPKFLQFLYTVIIFYYG